MAAACDRTEEPQAETTPFVRSDQFLSRTGGVMGTAGYMSPEQVRGETLNARTDLFSFGLVLYEMATGKRAFTGDTWPTLQEAILRQMPGPPRKANPAVPTKIEGPRGRAWWDPCEAEANSVHGEARSI
jgi:serine/threonine protein kinase